MKITYILPTLNRADSLLKAVTSVLRQTRIPDELIIVDQSLTNESYLKIKQIIPDNSILKLVYILDSNISGLIHAKKVGVLKSSGDLIYFGEDDIVLDEDFCFAIEEGFKQNSKMVGCSGIITNPPNQSNFYYYLFNLFHRSIFNDPRVIISRSFKIEENKLYLSNMISGGISAWKKKVFKKIALDTVNGFHMLEDTEFNYRVIQNYGSKLYINPNARVKHYHSSIGRLISGKKQYQKVIEYILFYKKVRKSKNADLAFLWLIIGLFFESLFQSIKIMSPAPLLGYCKALIHGLDKKIIEVIL